MKQPLCLQAASLVFALSCAPIFAQDQQPDRPPQPPRGKQDAPACPELKHHPRPIGGLFAALDRNHDGAVDREELAQAVDALRNLDHDADGRITPGELLPSPMRTSDFPSERSSAGTHHPIGRIKACVAKRVLGAATHVPIRRDVMVRHQQAISVVFERIALPDGNFAPNRGPNSAGRINARLGNKEFAAMKAVRTDRSLLTHGETIAGNLIAETGVLADPNSEMTWALAGRNRAISVRRVAGGNVQTRHATIGTTHLNPERKLGTENRVASTTHPAARVTTVIPAHRKTTAALATTADLVHPARCNKSGFFESAPV